MGYSANIQVCLVHTLVWITYNKIYAQNRLNLFAEFMENEIQTKFNFKIVISLLSLDIKTTLIPTIQ